MDRVLWVQGAAGHSHLCVQFGQLFLIQVGLFVDSGLVAELRPGVGYEGTQTYQILFWEQCLTLLSASQNEFRVSMEMAVGRVTFPGHQGLWHYNPYLVSIGMDTSPKYMECSRMTM